MQECRKENTRVSCIPCRIFLTPNTPELVNAMYYVLTEAAQRYDIKIHVALALGNHYYTELTDPRGVAPKFDAGEKGAVHGRRGGA